MEIVLHLLSYIKSHIHYSIAVTIRIVETKLRKMKLTFFILFLIITAWIQPILSVRCYSCNQTKDYLDPACVDADVNKMPVEDCGKDGICLFSKKAEGG